MPTWKEFKLGDIAKFQEGYVNPSQTKAQYFDGPIKWLRANDVTGSFVYKTSRTITKLGFESAGKSAQLFKPNSLVITKSGTIGRLGILKDYMCGNRAIINIEPLNQECNSLFLFYSLKNNTSKIIELAEGSVQKNLYIPILKEFKIKLPDLPTQTSVAEILSSIDDKIELNNQINKELEALAQALFKQWFIDFDFPNDHGQPYKSSGGEMVESALGEIPKGWKVGNLDFIAELKRENVKPFERPNDLFHHYSLPEFDTAKTPSIEVGEKILSSKYRVTPNSILVSKLNPRIPRIWSILECNVDSICSTEFQVVVPRNINHFGFVSSVCLSEQYIQSLQSKVTGTSSSHQRVNPKDIINYTLAIPPKEIMESYHSIVFPLLHLDQVNRKENQELSALRDSILPKLISGELEVSEPLTKSKMPYRSIDKMNSQVEGVGAIKIVMRKK